MTKDLEMTLAELGAGYRPMVEQMQRAFVEPKRARRWCCSCGGYLAAAGLALVLALSYVFCNREPAQPAGDYGGVAADFILAYFDTPEAIQKIISTQNADGSWRNDYITQQNAVVIKGVKGAEVAYRKAVRYLRAKGIAPLSESEFKSRLQLVNNLCLRKATYF